MVLRRFSTVSLAFDKWAPRSEPTATPIVFLHGLFGTKSNNRSVSRVLSRDLNCDIYCLDLRNHGQSPAAAEINYAAMSSDVAKFIEDHKLGSPVVIGHSMGARTAMALALTRKDLVSKLISVDNGPVTRGLSSDFVTYIRGMKQVALAEVAERKEADKIMAKYERNPAVRAFLLANFKREGDILKSRLPLDILAKGLDHVGEFNYLPGEYQYTGPTLLIRGTKSRFVPDEDLPVMGQLFPRFEVKDIDCGHWVISEKPKEFIQDVEEFLRKENE